MRHLLALLVAAAIAAAGCRSPETGPAPDAADAADSPAVADPDALAAAALAAAAADWEPLAAAKSPCGRYTLRLEHAEWRDAPGARPQLSLQFALRTGEPDVFACMAHTVTNLVPPDGTEFRFGDLKGYGVSRHASGMIAFHGLELYRRDDRLRRLRVETRVLRVLSWTTYDVSCEGPGARSEFVCAPYTVSLSGDPTTGGGGMCHVGACIAQGWQDFPAVQRDLADVLGHDWVAGSAVLTDAGGESLTCFGGGGSGGFTSMMYGPGYATDPAAPQSLIAWPVHGTIRLPERYVVEVVPFEFTDCSLVRSNAAK